MADYRQFCDACGNEVGFGSHKPGCSALAEQRRVQQERANATVAMQQSVRKLSDRDLEDEWSARRDLSDKAGELLREANSDGRFDYVKRQMSARGLTRDAIDRRYRGLRSNS